MKVAGIIRRIESDGWYQVAQRGSHRQSKNAAKLGRVTVAGKPSDNFAPGTLNRILKQAGLKGEGYVPDGFDDRHPEDVVADLPLHRRDPFDRIIVAQAMTEPVHLYTVDRKLAPYSPLVRLT